VSHGASAESDLAPEAVLRRLGTRRLGRRYEFLAVCASTNDVVRGRAAAGAAEGFLVVADSQTAGRGRLGRSWHSPPGQNLYLSLLLRPALPTRQAAPLTLLAGAALAHTLAEAGARPRLRWPNDILVGRRKLAGILVDRFSAESAVVGIGLMDTFANGLFVLASARGFLSIVSVLGSLYPAIRAASLTPVKALSHE